MSTFVCDICVISVSLTGNESMLLKCSYHGNRLGEGNDRKCVKLLMGDLGVDNIDGLTGIVQGWCLEKDSRCS